MAVSDYSVPASAILERFKANGVTHATTVPDLVQLSLHTELEEDADVQLIECAAENQALTTAFGLHVGGKTPVVVMQNQGLMNCLNTLRSVGLSAKTPMVISVGQFGREFANLGQPTDASSREVVNTIEPVLEGLGIPFERLETPEDIPAVDRCFAKAREAECPVVLLVGHYTAWA